MVSVFIKEQKRYTQDELVKRFKTTEEKTVLILKKLKEYGILKAVKAEDTQKDLTDLVDTDVQIADVEGGENTYFYVFAFVGVVTLENLVLKCYPKYINKSESPKDELKQVVKVLGKYNRSKDEIIKMYNETSKSTDFNMLAVMLYLLHDYHEYGPYTNTEDILETNGTGEILWDRTINESFTLLSNNRPYYPELVTRKNVVNEYDYFKRLHECVVSICSKALQDADLLDLFDIAGVDVSDEELSDFGSTDYILDSLEKELNVQFNTRKQLVLKTLYAYMSNNSNAQGLDCFSMYGTNSFNLVWEHICSEVLQNGMDKRISFYRKAMELQGQYKNSPDKKFSELIDKPEWHLSAKDNIYRMDTLIPDFISIGTADDGQLFFAIFDAKYYCMNIKSGTLRGNPGIESVTKQYLYQQAYSDFINTHKMVAYNAFLFPTEKNEVIDAGYVKLDMLGKLGLEDILLRELPAAIVYEDYLQGRHKDPMWVIGETV